MFELLVGFLGAQVALLLFSNCHQFSQSSVIIAWFSFKMTISENCITNALRIHECGELVGILPF